MIRPCRSYPSPRGFTLIELLVVISIIALLISILLPALANAREAAKASECLSRERQVYLAMRMYSDEWYGGKFMSAFQYDPAPNPSNPSANRTNLWPNRIVKHSKYLPNMDAARCPSNTIARPTSKHPDYSRDEYVAYGMREYVRWPSGATGYKPELANSYLIPGVESDWPLLADSVWTSGAFITPPGAQAGFIGWESSVHLRHNYAANLIYADGHGAATARDELKALPADHAMFRRNLIGSNNESIP